MDCQEAVLEFHRLYDVPIGVVPQSLSFDRLTLRLRLIQEEWDELQAAAGFDMILDGGSKVAAQDIVEMADALGDIVYVCFGMAIEMGVNLNEVFAEIQRANLSKLDHDGTPYRNVCMDEGCPHHGTPHICDALRDPSLPYDKVMKGPNYEPPNIVRVLRDQANLA